MLSGHTYTEAYLKSLIVFSLLGLGDLDIDIHPQNISGGQQQRVAFARAIVPDYQYLFGDEPTGNLDRKTSIEVLEMLSTFIRGTNANTSTVIVSHDIDLALKFADRIIIITKLNSKGTIEPENIFIRNKKEVIKENDKLNHHFKDVIRNYFDNNLSHANMGKLIEKAKEEAKKDLKVKEKGFVYVDILLEKLFELLKNQKSISDNNLCSELNTLLNTKKIKVSDIEKTSKSNILWHTQGDDKQIDYLEADVEKKIKKLLRTDNNKSNLSDKSGGLDKKVKNINIDSRIKRAFYKINEQILFPIYGFTCSTLRKTYKGKVFKEIPPGTGISNPDFINLFTKNEGGTLLGGKYKLSNFWTLFFAILVTFLGIGFAVGSLNYLDKKMNDSFVNFVTVSVPNDKQEEIIFMIESFNIDSTFLSTYNINMLTGSTIFPLEIFDFKTNELPLITGRTIDLDDPLLEQLIKDDYIIQGNEGGFFDPLDCGFIVSEKMLKKLGLDDSTRFIMINVGGEGNSSLVPIPVRSVLKEIPGDLNQDIDFMVTEYMRHNLLFNYDLSTDFPFHPSNSEALLIYINTPDSSIAIEYKNNLKNTLTTYKQEIFGDFRTRHFNLIKTKLYSENMPPPNTVAEEYIDPVLDQKPAKKLKMKSKKYTTYPGYQIEIGFMGVKPSYLQLQEMYSKTIDYFSEEGYDISLLEQIYTPQKHDPSVILNAVTRLDRITIHYRNLDKVEEFATYLANSNYKYLRLDMAKIRSMKNYNYVANLTYGIIIFLIVLSVYFISHFVARILANHLDRIKKNIGTLMAFGTYGLKYIYMNLLYSYVIMAMIFSFLGSMLIGYCFFSSRGILWLIYWVRRDFNTDFTLEPGGYFNIINFWALIVFILIIIFSGWMSRKKIRTVLQETPGNLIFGREKDY